MTAGFEARLEHAVRLLDERLKPATIVLFGSLAEARATTASDVDIGVLVGGSTTAVPPSL